MKAIFHQHRHKHQGLDPLIRSVSRVTTVLANVSSVFQLFFFLVVCSDMLSNGFGLVAFFASVKTSSLCIHLSCLVCSYLSCLSSSSCSGRIRFDSCSLYPQNEIGPSISSSVVLCVFVLLVYIVVLV